MKQRMATVVATVFIFSTGLSACGKKGDLLPPPPREEAAAAFSTSDHPRGRGERAIS
ncbi:MAG: hypothetical protein AAGC95_15005 [Pseudomonadota bacterium]